MPQAKPVACNLATSLQALLLDRLAPTAFLYLLHPHLPTASAAHALLAALLPAAPAARREQLVPFYIDRALEGYPGPTSTEALRQGLASTLSALPPGSAAGLYCLERLLARCAELEVAAQGSRWGLWELRRWVAGQCMWLVRALCSASQPAS